MNQQSVERLTYRVHEAAAALGISRSRCYQLVAQGTIPAIRIGASIRIPVAELHAMIARQIAEQRAQPTERAS